METIVYYHKNSNTVAFKRVKWGNNSWTEYTYDKKGNKLTSKDSNGYWNERTYDERGNELTFKNSLGYWREKTYDEKGNQLTFKDSGGYWDEVTFDERGNQLTYKDSDGYYRIKGKFATQEEFKAFVNNQNRPCVGKKVIVDGVEYELK